MPTAGKIISTVCPRLSFDGTCLAARSAVPSSRTSCSSFLIIKGNALTIRPAPVRLMFSRQKNVQVISRSFAKRVSRARVGLALRPQQAPACPLSSSITHVIQELECPAHLALPRRLVRRFSTIRFLRTCLIQWRMPCLLRLSIRLPQLGVFRTTPSIRQAEIGTSELQSHSDLVCRLLLEKKKINNAHM